MGLTILQRDLLKDGTKVQLEDWDGELQIGAYPLSKQDGRYGLQKKGKSFRLGLARFRDNDEASFLYDRIKDGDIGLDRMSDYYWNGDYDKWLMGLIDYTPPQYSVYENNYYVDHYSPEDPYAFHTEVDGEDICFGFDGKRTLTLFGGSMQVTYPKSMTYAEVKQDLIENYAQYKQDDLESHYRAWGYWD